MIRSPAVFCDFIDWIESLGLIAVFLLAMLDSLGLPATGDAILITSSATRDEPLGLIILVAFVGGVWATTSRTGWAASAARGCSTGSSIRRRSSGSPS